MKFIYTMFLIALCLTGCKSSASKTYKDGAYAEDTTLKRRENKFLVHLANKKINSLNEIIPDFDKNELKMVLVCSEFDCISCVNAGFEIINEVSHSNVSIKTYAVGTTKEIRYDIKRKYGKVVYDDKRNKLHEELDFIPLPVIVVFQENQIIDLHKPYDSKSSISRTFIQNYTY